MSFSIIYQANKHLLSLITIILLILPSINRIFAQPCEHTVIIQADPAGPYCIGQTITLTAIVTGMNGPFTYIWTTGVTTQSISYTMQSYNYVEVIVSDPSGCHPKTIFNVAPSLFSNGFTTPGIVCEGDSLLLEPNFGGSESSDLTYLWNTGATTLNIIVTTEGVYSITATNPVTGCTTSFGAFVSFGTSPPPATINGPSTLCSGQNATLSVSGGAYTSYIWSPGLQTTSTLNINQPGTYAVTVGWDENSCTSTAEIVIASGFLLPPNLTGPTSLCPGQNGLIVITNPTEYTAFSWSTGGTLSSITINNPGTYSVTVTESGGCTAIGSVTVNSGSSNITLSSIESSVTSCTSQNGAINLTVSPSGTYTYDWSNGATTQDITNLGIGTYTVTVFDAGGCTSTSSFIVTSNVILPNPTTNVTSASCGLNNGAVDLSVTPSGTYIYFWSNGQTTEDLTNILAGTYSVTVTSTTNGCTATTSVLVPNINTNINITGNTTPLSSCTASNGAIDITPAPSGVYTFVWSSGETTEDLTNLSAGNYTVTVSSSTGCTAIATYSVVNNTTSPALVATPSPATCGQSNGAIDLNVTPTGTYTYVWSNGGITEDLISITAGNYSVTVTSTDGCTSITSITVQDNLISFTISGTTSPNTSCINQNGAIDISVSPVGIYSYTWSNGATTEDLNNIPAGVYNVTVTFGLTCINTQSFEVLNNLTPITLSGNTTPNTSCSQSNGAIDITISTPGSFTYLWSNGEITEDLLNLTGGTYSLTVTGSNGCTSTEIFDIINTNSNFLLNGSVLPNTSCASPNGNIDLTLIPAGSYSFIWSNGASTEDLQNLSAGNYIVTVSDINQCALVEAFSIQDNLSYPIISSQVTPSTCSISNGAIDISIIPAIGNSYSWSNGSAVEDQSNLQAGNYFVTVTSINGCMSIDTIAVGNQNSIFTLDALTMPNSSCINSNGSVDLSITPSGTYSYIWNNGATTEDLLNMAAGSYTVTVTDILNCFTSDTFFVTENISIPILSANITSANCGANNGAIDLIVNPTGNNIFLWSDGSTAEDLTAISPGSYSVIVTDSTNGCQALDTFTVQNINNNFSLSATTVPNTSCLSQNGSIDLTITPSGTYTFIWSNGSTSEDLNSLNAGSYTVTVTDNASCSSSAIFIIGNITPIITISTAITPSTCGNNNGAIDLTLSPSVGNSFLWSNGAITEDLQNVLSGIYSLTITGSNGCITSDTVLVPDIGSFISLYALPTANTNCILPNGSIDLSVSPTGMYTYSWSNGFSTEDLTNLSPGNYIVTVSDNNGCSSLGSYTIEDQTISFAISEIISPSTCGQNNGQIDLNITPVGNYQFIWSTGDTIEDLQNIASGTYFVTVTSDNDCTASTTLLVPNTNSNFSVSASTSDNTSCTTSNGAINLTVAPSGTYTFIWSNGATSEDLQNLPSGIYTVTVTNISNCSAFGSYILVDNVVDLIVEETITPALCGDENGRIDLNVTPPTGNSFIWSDGTTTSNLENIYPGQYSVTVTGQNGCTWSSAFTMPGNEKLELTIEADAIQNGDASVTISVQVNLPITALDTLIWLPENLFNCPIEFCLEQTITRPAAQTEIKVIAIDTNGCIAEARLSLQDISDPKVFIPNVFSPNADGINDMFTVYGNKDVEMIDELQIFDRWGNQMFVNTEFPPNEEIYGWDGSFKNAVMNPAVFAYWARVRFKDGTEGSFKGDVTLVR